MAYRYVLACEVAEDILELSARQRGEFVRLFRSLAENPFEPGERSFKDSSGRDIQKKDFGRWRVSYWTDHPLQEVRIVGIQKAQQ